MVVDYSYQERAAKIVLKNALNKRYMASILAACPGSGKTTTSHKIINKYLSKRPDAKILVLTEGQNLLKNQYLNELSDANVPINFTYGDFNSEAQVRIGIPQGIKKLNWDSIDLLIVDEAHNFYTAPMVQNIIKKLKPKHQVLMTGSPSRYNSQKDKYSIYYIAANELKKKGVFSAVDLDVARISNKDNPHMAIKDVMKFAKSRKYDLSKIMVACPGIEYAKKVGQYFTGIGRKVSISTSDNDKSGVEIGKFKNNETNVLIVVDKGILGFNDKYMTCLIDLKCSSNIDSSYQLFARVLRTHPENIKKSYIRVTDKNYNKEVLTLHKMCALMEYGIFKGFTGKNLKIELSA